VLFSTPAVYWRCAGGKHDNDDALGKKTIADIIS
jgi:hypothetical protein